MTRPDESDSSTRSFDRGLRVLISVAEAGEIRADELAEEVGLPLSTVYRYLRSLRELNLVEQQEGSYLPGWRLLDLAGQHLTLTRLVEVGQAHLDELREGTGETAVLTVRVGLRAMCLRQAESHHGLRYAFRINQLLPLYAGAGQRMLLAHTPAPVVEQVLSQPLRRFTTRTPDRQQVEAGLDRTRHDGYAVSYGELNDGAVAVATPVIANGEIACSLTVAGPKVRCTARWQKAARVALLDASQLLAEALACHEPRTRRAASD